MSIHEGLAQVLERTFDDGVITKAERREVKALLAENHLERRDRDWLRSRIFDFAQAKVATHKPLQILEWLEQANKLLLDKTAPQHWNRVYFSPSEDCLAAIINLIKSATRSLDLCVFTISDNRISDAIVEAHTRGIKVRIVTDNDKMYDKGSDVMRMVEKGVPTRVDRTDHHMHHKYAVIDGATTITGSYNWTRSAEKYNWENVLITNDPATAKPYLKEFERLWDAFE